VSLSTSNGEHCRAKRADGAPCRGRPHEDGFCLAHSPARVDDIAEARRRGGRNYWERGERKRQAALLGLEAYPSPMPFGGYATRAAGFGTPPLASVQSDVYALGVTGYWLLAGRTPHDFSSANDSASQAAIVVNSLPTRLRDVAPHVPRYVASVLEKAMSRLPGDRYASGAALNAELGRRPAVQRLWTRTDEHGASHAACWRGQRAGRADYLVCLEQRGPKTWEITTTVHPRDVASLSAAGSPP
jgi:hypothetical protein